MSRVSVSEELEMKAPRTFEVRVTVYQSTLPSLQKRELSIRGGYLNKGDRLSRGIFCFYNKQRCSVKHDIHLINIFIDLGRHVSIH